jgi:hypothetical protein
MAHGKRKLIGPAAVSVLAAASLAAASTAGADVVCTENCVVEPPGFNAPGLENAFVKLAHKDFPGNTSDAFLQKVDTQNAFVKLAQKDFPGNTGNVFIKKG